MESLFTLTTATSVAMGPDCADCAANTTSTTIIRVSDLARTACQDIERTSTVELMDMRRGLDALESRGSTIHVRTESGALVSLDADQDPFVRRVLPHCIRARMRTLRAMMHVHGLDPDTLHLVVHQRDPAASASG